MGITIWTGVCLSLLLFQDSAEAFVQRHMDFGPQTKHATRYKRQGRGIYTHRGAHSSKHIVGSVFFKRFGSSSITSALRGGSVMASVAVSPPALAVWIGPALLSALSYALYNLFIKKAATHNMDPILGGVLLQFVAATVGTLLWLVQRTTSSKAAVVSTRTAMAWAAAAGLAVGAAELLSFFISGMGVQAMQSIPIVVGGSVLMGTVLGRVWLKEMLTWKGWCGVALISIGIALVGIDPGSSGAMH
mmetsp:Transcript_15155/g.30821  ORF Transcript_15155/g.30821 Transcript_15155/m.30821 type:complete len:246 (-) Transcript_15155:130-867(-)